MIVVHDCCKNKITGTPLYSSFTPETPIGVKTSTLHIYPSSLSKLPQITPKISKGLFYKHFNAQQKRAFKP